MTSVRLMNNKSVESGGRNTPRQCESREYAPARNNHYGLAGREFSHRPKLASINYGQFHAGSSPASRHENINPGLLHATRMFSWNEGASRLNNERSDVCQKLNFTA